MKAKKVTFGVLEIACLLAFLLPVSGPEAAGQGRPIWADEFNGTRIDTSVWDTKGLWYEPNRGSVGGAELDLSSQSYLDGRGHLVIRAQRRVDGRYTWVSGMLSSSPRGARPGFAVRPPFYVEFRAELPAAGPGLWPGLWLLHDGGPYQELDVMESLGKPSTIYASWHQDSSSASRARKGLGPGFHTYGADVTATSVTAYVDGAPVGPPVPVRDPGSFFLVIDLAVGSTHSWPGPATAATPNPAYLVVDYVRVYR